MGCTSGFHARDDLPRAHLDETEFNLIQPEVFSWQGSNDERDTCHDDYSLSYMYFHIKTESSRSCRKLQIQPKMAECWQILTNNKQIKASTYLFIYLFIYLYKASYPYLRWRTIKVVFNLILRFLWVLLKYKREINILSWHNSEVLFFNIQDNLQTLSISFKLLLFGPRQANLVLIAYASSEGSGEPVHPRSLARTSAARSYKYWVKRNLQTESQIPGPSEWLGMRS